MDSIRLNALRIAARFLPVADKKNRQDYKEQISSHLIKVMMEDPRDRLRKEAITIVELNDFFLPYIIKKTLDVSTKVRNSVYKTLLKKNYAFDKLRCEDRITIVTNGLKDHESDVVTSCKDYLAASICAKEGEVPEIVRGIMD